MKERIRLLADEAAKWAQTMNWSSDPKYGDRPFSDLFNEKFAELVVQECVNRCLTAKETKYSVIPPFFMISQDQVVDDCVEKIKEHFGVEL